MSNLDFYLLTERPEHETPLLTFVVLLSLVVGTLIVTLTVSYTLLTAYTELFQLSLLIIHNLWIIAGLALLASLFHAKRNLISVYRVLSNLSTSWLSREVLCVSALFILLLAYPILYPYEVTIPHHIHNFATTIIAVTALFVMTKTYMMISRPSWNHITVLISSFLATFVLGFSFLGMIYVYFTAPKSVLSQPILLFYFKLASAFILMAVTISLIIQVFYLNYLKRSGLSPRISRHIYLYRQRALFRFRLASALALIILAAGSILYIYDLGIGKLIASLVVLQFALALTTVVTEKMLFYLSKSPPVGFAKMAETYLRKYFLTESFEKRIH